MSRSFLLLNPNANISNITFGVEKQPLLKVDSYLTDPQVLIDFAINKNQFSPSNSFYPGIRMPLPISYIQALIHNLGADIEATFGVDLKKIKTAVATFSIITTPAENLEFFQTIPHFDGLGENKLAILHYLSDMPDTGTCFYHHKALGYDYVDDSRYQGYLDYLDEQFKDRNQASDTYICDDSAEFEKIASYQCVFNRLLIYKASSLHSGLITSDYNFDPNPKTGRLTIASFIEFNP
ncbi:DUF6445 family protein [Colwellia echini]|uniref:Uncharacterized protein n=1 Tax=Colwellia echini TaxID=1982103 RepID=A0ABY3MZ03_9GAMM|nr:DUF6445 family protein [Colwellia echini]TYK66404.1 hypothetical protein CWS31_005470 [Colwellia echini]